VRAIVIVEGVSDQVAVEALAARRGIDLGAEGVALARTGGAHGIGRFLDGLGRDQLVLAALCDAGEEHLFQRAFERHGLERSGLFVCDRDLEDELIRSHGAAGVEKVLAAHDDLGLFRVFQQQPAQRGREIDAQLRRFLGVRAGRKAEYARFLVEALDPSRVPRPLDGVLAHVMP
jgi:hypothetical protein